MSSSRATTDAFDRGVAKIPTCALDEAGMSEQRARYARLAASVTRVQREPGVVRIEFDKDFDRQALDQALAVERECCPFFQFAFDEQRRRLRATLAETEQLPALDAIADAFGAAHRVTPKS